MCYPLQYSWASLVVQLVKNPHAMWETWVGSLGWEDPGEGKGYLLQYSGLENSIDYSPWGWKESDTTEWLSLYDLPGGADCKESACSAGDLGSIWIQSLGWEDDLEKEKATHFSIFAWRIPWTEEPDRLHVGSQRVRHNWATSLHFFKGRTPGV